MKKICSIVLVIALMFWTSSCGNNTALFFNKSENSTQVQPQSDNFKIVRQGSDSAHQDYVLMIGGMYQTRLYQAAYANMIKDAEFAEGSQALINVITEEHTGGVFPFYYKRTVTVSGQVVEFTK